MTLKTVSISHRETSYLKMPFWCLPVQKLGPVEQSRHCIYILSHPRECSLEETRQAEFDFLRKTISSQNSIQLSQSSRQSEQEIASYARRAKQCERFQLKEITDHQFSIDFLSSV